MKNNNIAEIRALLNQLDAAFEQHRLKTEQDINSVKAILESDSDSLAALCCCMDDKTLGKYMSFLRSFRAQRAHKNKKLNARKS
jgi:ferritin-like metal-binding protein YciE